MAQLSDSAYKAIADKTLRQAIIDGDLTKADLDLVKAAREADRKEHQQRDLCEPCKISLAKHGCVCSTHYHDYEDCGRDTCFICLIYARGPYS